MPSATEFEQLVAFTESEWVYNYNGTGVADIVFTGHNGNHIFLPAAGYREQTWLKQEGLQGYGYYWSGSLNPDNPSVAFYLRLYQGIGKASVLYEYREYGFSVRPVRP